MFSVVGNHEMTFYADNPFWTMVQEWYSARLDNVANRAWGPIGLETLLLIPDSFVFGDTRFLFNHSGLTPLRPILDGKKHVGLFHIDLYDYEIIEYYKKETGAQLWNKNFVNFSSSTAPLRGYDYAFVGHGHKYYGQWKFQNEDSDRVTYLEYLSTLGRTNETEVDNDFLERNIPALLFKEGKLTSKEDNKFTLLSREDSVSKQEK
jgi:hypothetical protein